jgi:hypothetical protein
VLSEASAEASEDTLSTTLRSSGRSSEPPAAGASAEAPEALAVGAYGVTVTDTSAVSNANLLSTTAMRTECVPAGIS